MSDNGAWAFDCLTNEMVLLRTCVLALLGDNPMQSEFACHIGLKGKRYCRICEVEGDDEHEMTAHGTESLEAIQNNPTSDAESIQTEVTNNSNDGPTVENSAMSVSNAKGKAKGKGKGKSVVSKITMQTALIRASNALKVPGSLCLSNTHAQLLYTQISILRSPEDTRAVCQQIRAMAAN